MGKKFSDLFSAGTAREQILSFMDKGMPVEDFETCLATKEGTGIWANVLLRLTGDRTATCFVIDISARKLAEKTAEEHIIQYRQFTENSPAGILLVQGGVIRTANPAFLCFLGYSEEELIGRDLCSLVDERSRADCGKIIQVAEGNTAALREGSLAFRTRSGDLRIAGFSATRVQHSSCAATLITLIDTTEQQHLEEKIRLDNERRRGIIMTVAHELRTPLQPIMGYLNLLVQDPAGFGLTGNTKEILDRCISSVDRERKIINQMLDLSVLESGKLQLSWSQFSLASLVRSVIDASGYADKAEIRTHIPGDLVIAADMDRLFVVIDSLISNAVNYSTPPRAVTVTYLPDRPDTTHQIVVADKGIGIPEYALTSIFEPFQLADAAKLSRPFGRIGISLSIARKIMHLHGGDITVESTMGAGSRFTIHLPKKKIPGP